MTVYGFLNYKIARKSIDLFKIQARVKFNNSRVKLRIIQSIKLTAKGHKTFLSAKNVQVGCRP